ncbi:methyl transferase [Beauveria bassiana polymycovirus 1]|uniref:Methyl transferase n=1 Tax=Beauveria bassiana polymycovirus 1 TaxID=1740646 RepID=A0A1V1IEU4_9VIRU|nr:methyl transferase [Beauveria bassiana polymycovirus 1]CUS18597.1 methyl transferase [Beauveria bassiana polymycovirus 1]
MPARNIQGSPRRVSAPTFPELPLRPRPRAARSDSSRSVSTARRGDAGHESVQGVVPLTRIDFSQHRAAVSQGELPLDVAWVDDGGRRFMASPEGKELSRRERRYATLTREVLSGVVRLRGARVLVLGCGSSRHLLSIAKAAPECMVFVDTSEAALRRMARLMGEAGYSEVVDDEYQCVDAWAYAHSDVCRDFDVVLITKCLGQVFKHEPSRKSVYGLLEALQHGVRPDGVVVVDHHTVFSHHPVGTLVTDIVVRGQRDRATIGGRFVDDVCYSAETTHDGFDLVLQWNDGGDPLCAQSWEQFVYRRVRPPRVPRTGVVYPVHDVAPVPFDMVPMQEVDQDLDMIVPRSFNGVKRVVTESDVSALDLSTALPKFDGIAGTLIISGNDAVFLSSSYRSVHRLSFAFSAPLVLAAELVEIGGGEAVIAIVGAFCVADVECDPYSFADLQAVADVLRPLSVDGFFVTDPAILRTVDDHDFVRLGPSSGRHVKVPIDGINLVRDGIGGEFIKPNSKCTVDLAAREGQEILREAYARLGLRSGDLVSAAASDKSTLVCEFAVDPHSLFEWSVKRCRFDKRFSNTLGRTMVDVCSALAAFDVFDTGGVRTMINRLTA